MNRFMMKRYSSYLSDFLLQDRKELCTKVKVLAGVPEWLRQEIDSGAVKPRRHPGVIRSHARALPRQIKDAILQVIGDTPLKQVMKDGKTLNGYLQGRHLPLEQDELREKKLAILREVEEKIGFRREGASEEELEHHSRVVSSRVGRALKQRVYHWQRVEFLRHTGLSYLAARALAEFSVLHRVFGELAAARPSFSPTTLFDFGSGVGTALWAAESTWSKSIGEFLCVDTSPHMCDIAAEVIGKSRVVDRDRVFHRQFLPATNDRKYDIVTSAYTLMELENRSSRLKVLHNLWEKTHKYLVLVERGTNAHFKLMNEARDFILMNSKNEKTDTLWAHIVAPCAHEFSCPRYENDQTPCNFSVQFEDSFNKGQVEEELFSYLIISKGVRDQADEQWPRVVRPVLLRSRHVVCKLCTNSGRLENITLSPTKPNKATYRCAKASRWGDLLPVDIKYLTLTKGSSSSSSSDEEEDVPDNLSKSSSLPP